MAEPQVIARIGADITDLRAELTQARDEIRKFAKDATDSSKMGNLLSDMKSLLEIGAISAPFVVAGQAAANFEEQLRNVNSIARMNEKDLAKFAGDVRGLTQELGLGVGPAEAMAASYEIMSAGFTGAADAQAVLKASIVGAAAGLTDTKTMADVLTSALNAYGDSASQAGRYTDVLSKAVELGKTTHQELAQSLGQGLATFAQAGVSIEEIAAALATMTSAGIKTPEAVTSLNQAIMQMLAPGGDAVKTLEGLGISAEELKAKLKGEGLGAALQSLVSATGGDEGKLRAVLGDVSAVKAALALAGSNAEKFAQNLDAMGGAGGTALSQASEQAKAFNNQMKAFKSALEEAGVAAGNTFLPTATDLVQAGKGLLDAFNQLPEPVQRTAVTFATLGAAGGIGAIAFSKVAEVANALGLSMGGAGKAATGLGSALKYAATTNVGTAWGQAGVAAAGMGTSIKGAALAAQGFVVANGAMIASLGALVAVGAAATFAALKYAEAVDAEVKAMDDLVNAGAKAMDGISGKSLSAGEAIAKTAEQLKAMGYNSRDLADKANKLRVTLDEMGDASEEERQKVRDSIKALADKGRELSALEIKEKEHAGAASAGQAKAAQATAAAAQRSARAWSDFEERRRAGIFAGPDEELAALERTIPLLARGTEEYRKAMLEREGLARKAGEAAAKSSQKAADQATEDALHELDVRQKGGELTAAQEVAGLQRILAAHRGSKEVRQRLEEELAAARKRLNEETVKNSEEAAEKRVEHLKSALERLKSERDVSLQEEIEYQRKIVAATKVGTDARASEEKRLHDLVRQLREQSEQQAKALSKALADEKVKEIEDLITAQEAELEKARERGEATTAIEARIIELMRERARIQGELIDQETAEAQRTATDEQNRARMSELGEKRKADVARDANREIQSFQEAQVKKAGDIVQANGRVADSYRGAADEAKASGDSVIKTLEQVLEEQRRQFEVKRTPFGQLPDGFAGAAPPKRTAPAATPETPEQTRERSERARKAREDELKRQQEASAKERDRRVATEKARQDREAAPEWGSTAAKVQPPPPAATPPASTAATATPTGAAAIPGARGGAATPSTAPDNSAVVAAIGKAESAIVAAIQGLGGKLGSGSRGSSAQRLASRGRDVEEADFLAGGAS